MTNWVLPVLSGIAVLIIIFIIYTMIKLLINGESYQIDKDLKKENG